MPPRPEELLASAIADLLAGARRVAVGMQSPVPGAGALPDDVKDFLDFRDRFIAISADVWEAFEAGSVAVPAAMRDLVAEYYDLFLKITRVEIAPFYVGAAPDFFGWIREVLGLP